MFKSLFAQQAKAELLQVYIDNLKRLGYPVTLGLAVSLILIGLRKEFEEFVQNYNMHSLGKTVNKLHAMLKLHEQTLNCQKTTLMLYMYSAGLKSRKVKSTTNRNPHRDGGDRLRNGKHKHAFAPKAQIPPHKREVSRQGLNLVMSVVRQALEVDCPQYLAELLKKKKNTASGASGSRIFTIELNTFLNRSWIYDTGCGTHICNTTQGLRERRKTEVGGSCFVRGQWST
ncbi:hypothetical protein Tco_0242406 [Tanacetum coccineum]